MVRDERYIPPFQISKSLKLKWLQLTKRAAKKLPVWSHWVSASLILGVDHFEQTINPSKTSQWQQIHLRFAFFATFSMVSSLTLQKFSHGFSILHFKCCRQSHPAGHHPGHHGTAATKGRGSTPTKIHWVHFQKSAYKLVGEPNPFFAAHFSYSASVLDFLDSEDLPWLKVNEVIVNNNCIHSIHVFHRSKASTKLQGKIALGGFPELPIEAIDSVYLVDKIHAPPPTVFCCQGSLSHTSGTPTAYWSPFHSRINFFWSKKWMSPKISMLGSTSFPPIPPIPTFVAPAPVLERPTWSSQQKNGPAQGPVVEPRRVTSYPPNNARFADFQGWKCETNSEPAVVTQVFFEGILSWDRRIAVGDRKPNLCSDLEHLCSPKNCQLIVTSSPKSWSKHQIVLLNFCFTFTQLFEEIISIQALCRSKWWTSIPSEIHEKSPVRCLQLSRHWPSLFSCV